MKLENLDKEFVYVMQNVEITKEISIPKVHLAKIKKANYKLVLLD